MAFKITNYYDNIFGKQIKNAKAEATDQKRDINKRYNAQINRMENDTDKTIIASENSYDAAYADNAVQKEINERHIKETMSSAGLSDSGLNRTQITAVNLQKANADRLIGMQKMNFVNQARAKLADYKFQANLERSSEINAVDRTLNAEIHDINNSKRISKMEKTEEIINNIIAITDPTQAAAYIKTVSSQYGIKAEKLVGYSSVVNKNTYQKYLKNKNYFINRATYKDLHASLVEFDTTTASGQTAAAKAIKAWANTHKKDATISKIKKLCESAGISYSEYEKFLKDGQYFVKKNKTTTKTGNGSGYYYKSPVVDEDEDEDEVEENDFSNYDATDWNIYFTGLRKKSPSLAEEEFKRLSANGTIESDDLATARISAYGTFGH